MKKKQKQMIILATVIFCIVVVITTIVVMNFTTEKKPKRNDAEDRQTSIEIAKMRQEEGGYDADSYEYKIEKKNTNGTYSVRLTRDGKNTVYLYLVDPEKKTAVFVLETLSNKEKESLVK